MVKWSDSWLEKVDANNVKLKLWVIKRKFSMQSAHSVQVILSLVNKVSRRLSNIQNVLTIRIYQALDLIQEMPKSKQHSCQQLLLIINKSNKS